MPCLAGEHETTSEFEPWLLTIWSNPLETNARLTFFG